MSLAHYLEWRGAARRFGLRPWQLNSDQRALVGEQAAREESVITAALGSPQAAEVQADHDEVRAAIDAMSEHCADRQIFLAELARSGLDDVSLYAAVAAELRAGLALERIGARAVVTDDEVAAYYERHRMRMVLAERRAARHILITVNDAYPENSRSGALSRVGALADALMDGADFGDTAMRHSECPSALDGGRLGEVRRGQLYPELESALFTLEPGEIRAVESPLGFHLLRCDAVIPLQPMSLTAVAPAIRRKLESSARKRVLREWLVSARAEGQRRINQEIYR